MTEHLKVKCDVKCHGDIDLLRVHITSLEDLVFSFYNYRVQGVTVNETTKGFHCSCFNRDIFFEDLPALRYA